MMFEGLLGSIVDYAGDVYRNIPSIRVSQDLLDDLSDDPAETAYGEAAATEDSQSDKSLSAIISRPFQYGTIIGGAPYGRPVTRFSDGTRFGVWYGSLDLVTTLHETIYHWRRRLDSIQSPITGEVVSERRVFLVHAGGLFIDLRGKHRKFPGLVDNSNYAFTHAVGAYLHDQGQNGLIVNSARYNEGSNLAAFKQGVLSDPRHRCYLSYHWAYGSREVRIQRAPGKTWKVIAV